MKKKLRQYQQEASDALYNHLLQFPNKKGLVAIPTAGGKSLVIADIVNRVGGSWLVVTHSKELVQQNYDEFVAYSDKEAGIFCEGLGRKEIKNVTFATIQSIKTQNVFWNNIAIDEIHLLSKSEGTVYQQYLASNPTARIIGLTATPYRLDGGGLIEQGICETLVYDVPAERLIREGFLAPLVDKCPRSKIAIEENVKLTAGEYNIKDAAEYMMYIQQNEKVIAHAIISCANRNRWLVFCCDIEHAELTCKELISKGVNSAVVHSQLPDSDRDKIIKDFKEGVYTALVNVDILTTGFNVPEIDAIICLRPTNSTSKWIQIMGRGMRNAPGKIDTLILDYCGNFKRCGNVIAPWINRNGAQDPYIECECEAFFRRALYKCPQCGKEHPKEKREDEQKEFRKRLGEVGEQLTDNLYYVKDLKLWRHKSKSGQECIKEVWTLSGKEAKTVYCYHSFQTPWQVGKFNVRFKKLGGKGYINKARQVFGYGCDYFEPTTIPEKVKVIKDGEYERVDIL